MANNVDPDEKACYDTSHMALHCLQKYRFWSAGLKGLTHLCLEDSSTITLWTGLFPIAGWLVFIMTMFYSNS